MKTLVTLGELWYIRRLRKGLTQVQMAAAKGLTRYAYRKKEEDEGVYGLYTLSSYEALVLHRRRTGWTMAELAADMGISEYWYSVLELNEDPRVKETLCELTTPPRGTS